MLLSSDRHLHYLIDRGVISHKNIDEGSVSRRTSVSGVTGLYSGEVVGYASNKEALLKMWIESPKHRAVLLSRDWNWIGISFTQYRNNVVCVINFSSGLLGSVYTVILDDSTEIKGKYIGFPTLRSEKGIDLVLDKDNFTIFIPKEKTRNFFYIYNAESNLTDQINIF